MALQGKFILNEADYSPLTIYGVGTFLAFSGNGAYRNRGGCAAVPKVGPIPAGKYWIVQRGEGGYWSKKLAASKDWYNKTFKDAEFKHSEWFALYRDGVLVNDYMWINNVHRGNFRLHPGRYSEGCITLLHNSDFALIRNELLRTQPVPVPCMKNLMARGFIEVISNGNTCP
ncbi:DUF2778 domain-containing protein [Kosakonia sacchari]|uniref:DUF2778 domain-containing protein n=1 Tax=Kosakonia sacchari TaxID=1158459 RepID=UPI002ACE89E8|nr:DUF2778 domain-containing protein [Kosakonia sacchari]MDZ7320768.1 DUF2778 domain-containing protein [Kosakonia sacchari]